MGRCNCCGSVIKDDGFINCCICSKSFKLACVNLNTSDLGKINSDCGLTWSCRSCAKFNRDLISLKSLVLSLQEDIKSLKSCPVTQPKSNNSLMESEVIIREVMEREKRKNNIIVFGVEERNCGSSKELVEADTNIIKDIFTSFDVGVDGFKPVRLGKYDPSKSNRKRPIKVSLPSDDLVNKILRKSSLLKASPRFSGIVIARDQTPMQQDLYKSVKAELFERKAKGEINIRIKYVKGVPTIVDSEN